MALVEIPPQAFLRECFDYHPDTGLLTWRQRPTSHFASEALASSWNTQHAGRPALRTSRGEGYLGGEVQYEGRRVRLRTHRVVFAMFTGEQPPEVDHRDLDVANNRIENLRAATRLQNAQNITGRRGKLLPKGVFKEGRKFAASIAHGSRRVRLGSFGCATRAYLAYCAAAKARHGEFFNSGGRLT